MGANLTTTVTERGQITVPATIRRALGVKTGDRLRFRIHDGMFVLDRVPTWRDLAGAVKKPVGLPSGYELIELEKKVWRERL